MPPQADLIDGKKSVSPETLDKLVAELDAGRRRWRMAVEFVSGCMIKAVSTEDEAREMIKVLRKKRAEREEEAKSEASEPFCIRCKESFPIVDAEKEGRRGWAPGSLNKVKFANKRIRTAYKDWLEGDLHGEPWLCGACYFDVLDGESPSFL